VESVKVSFFRRGWVTLSANFRRKGASTANHCWCHKTRVIAVSKVPQSLQCLALCDHNSPTLQTDGQTDERTRGPHAHGISATCVYICRAKNLNLKRCNLRQFEEFDPQKLGVTYQISRNSGVRFRPPCASLYPRLVTSTAGMKVKTGVTPTDRTEKLATYSAVYIRFG